MNHYEVENKFCVRAPYLPFCTYKVLENPVFEDNLKSFIEINFSENLRTLSPDLFDIAFKSQTIKKNVNLSLLKYLIRSSARTTPYGLASGILKGSFSDIQNFTFNGFYLKSARPDMEWLVKVIKICEKQLKKNLIIQRNSSFSIEGQRLEKLWNSCYMNEESRNKRIHIHYAKAVQYIFKLSEAPISINSLLSKLQELYPKQDSAFLLRFIYTLLEKEFLISNLRRGNEIENQLSTLILTLDAYPIQIKITPQLKEVSSLLSQYNKSNINQDENLYIEIIDKMSQIVSSKNYLQIDMYSTERILLPNNLKPMIEEFSSFISNITYHEEYDDYVLKFIDKYGSQFVKYIDVIRDSELGIPSPSDIKRQNYENTLLRIMISIFLENESMQNIDLYTYKNKFKLIKTDSQYLPDSAELAFFVVKDKKVDFKFITSPLGGSDFAGKITGRFNYLFKEKMHLPENTADLSFIPGIARHFNVITSVNPKENKLVEFGCFSENREKSILLDDIYMGVENHHIHFYDRKSNEEIRFISSNMFVDEGYPDILKNLIKISHNQQSSLLTLYRSLLKIVTLVPSLYMPRITYKNIVIIPKTWKLDQTIFYKNETIIPFKIFKIKIHEYKDSYQIPDRILVGAYDNKLLLNLNSDLHLEILWNLFKDDKTLLMMECLFNEDNIILHSEDRDKSYIGEFIFKLLKKESKVKQKKVFDNSFFIDTNLYYETSKPFFSDWLYLKIYLDDIMENELLVTWVTKLCQELYQQKLISNFFYIRYKDPRDHLRLRFKVRENRNMVLQIIQEKIDFIREKQLVADYRFDTYFPETNRYGGINCLETAETMFGADSNSCIELITLQMQHLCPFNLNELFLISANEILNDFNLSKERQLDILKDFLYGKRKTEEYTQYKRKISAMIKNPKILRETSDGIRLLINFDERRDAYEQFGQQINQNHPKNLEYQKEIILSVLHMHFNRLIGVNRELERRLMGYLRKMIYSVYQEERYRNE